MYKHTKDAYRETAWCQEVQKVDKFEIALNLAKRLEVRSFWCQILKINAVESFPTDKKWLNLKEIFSWSTETLPNFVSQTKNLLPRAT